MTQNRPPILTLPGAMPVEGGVPMTVNETVIGAMGVSGGDGPAGGPDGQSGGRRAGKNPRTGSAE